MATKAAIKRKPASLSVAEPSVLAEPDYVLLEYSIKKLSAEQHLRPEAAARGSYTVSHKADLIELPDSVENPNATVLYTIDLIGYKNQEQSGKAEKAEKAEKKLAAEKSFSVSIKIEGHFKLSSFNPDNEPEMKSLIPRMMQQMHIVAMDRVREMVFDLGYKGVRPNLGIENIKIGRIESAA